MDRTVTARFYRLSDKPEGVPDFHDVLLEYSGLRTALEREQELEDGVVFRLENYSVSGEFVLGDFCRKQTENIPPEAYDGGLAPVQLAHGGGLGHVAAFRYHVPTRVLLLQFNRLCGGTTRVGLYVAAHNPAAMYSMQPVMRGDAWERFQNRQVRAFEVGFATPANLEALDDQGVAAATGARELAQAYDGVTVTITVGVGRRRNRALNTNAVRRTIRRILGSHADTTTLKVDTGPEEHDRYIDFVHEHLKDTEILDLDGNDTARNYSIRRDYLARLFNANLDFLNRQFRPRR